jgi:hypothetical protein
VGKQAACADETACALNIDLDQNAISPRLTTGLLSNENVATPWLVFAETAENGHSDIRVMRLDLGGTPADLTDDRFIPVGGSVNRQCLGGSGLAGGSGAQPDILFVGNVPHVAWIETVAGQQRLYVCHLGDVRFGQERWDLDSYFPLNHNLLAVDGVPVLASDGATPYVAWQESGIQAQVYVARRSPATPAWGSNRPPYIRTISWSRDLNYYALSADAVQVTPQRTNAQTDPLTLTTSCNHAGGWEHIREIQYKVANDEMTAFLGRYVADENKVYVEDPTRPGTFFPGVTPGSGGPVDTANAVLYTADMVIRNHGPGSPALDIDWIISFKDTTKNQDFAQMINIIYDDSETGFFETGLLSFDLRSYLSAVRNQGGETR